MASPITFHKPDSQKSQDPIKRLSLAVRQLDNLIDRANQLANLHTQPHPLTPKNDQKGNPSNVSAALQDSSPTTKS